MPRKSWKKFLDKSQNKFIITEGIPVKLFKKNKLVIEGVP